MGLICWTKSFCNINTLPWIFRVLTFTLEKVTDTVRLALYGQYLRWFFFFFVYHGSNCTKQAFCTKLNDLLLMLLTVWVPGRACVCDWETSDTGLMITTPHRCGCGGKSCLSNNLPLVHFQLWLQPTTLILFLSQNCLFSFIFPPVAFPGAGLGRNVCFPTSDLTCAHLVIG